MDVTLLLEGRGPPGLTGHEQRKLDHALQELRAVVGTVGVELTADDDANLNAGTMAIEHGGASLAANETLTADNGLGRMSDVGDERKLNCALVRHVEFEKRHCNPLG